LLKARLIVLSFVMLFVELALIRWAGSNVIHLSYFSNFVLLGSFLGIGVGFLRARHPRPLFPYAPLALALLVAFIALFPVDIDHTGSDLIFFSGGLERSGPPRELMLPIIFIAVAAALACIADGVARAFARFEPLEAYRLDVVGSLLGIIGFAVISLLRAPPVAWGAVAAVCLLGLDRPQMSWTGLLRVAPLVAVVVILGIESTATGTSWSPYYKIETDVDEAEKVSVGVKVNGVPHQRLFEDSENISFYSTVYERIAAGELDDVLVVGAGGGNDVALALREGAGRVDAVEIDPRLYEIGTELHPNRPYDDPRVDIHIDDGRAYLERTDRRYDLILFALPDSITLVAGQSALRLESYLFTREAIESARDHLAPGGAFAMYNSYREQWLIDRYAGTLDEVFGVPPCVDRIGDDFAVLVASEQVDSLRCETTWERPASVVEPASDDHPFPYLRERSLPTFYLVTIALILLASLVAVRLVGGQLRAMSPYGDLFFMGAAFLLLETKNVVQFALLFGTTWFVNALVFAGVLLSVLAAIEVARRITLERPARLYAVLVVALVVAYVVPADALLELDVVPRFAVAVSLAFAPIFLANLVFAQRFKDVGESTAAFGANLLGAMFGGLLEYGALVTGYRALLLVVMALYGLAFVLGRAHLRAGGRVLAPA
jgi:hypothetical protein